MTWSGNARPIPQVQIGIPEYVQLLPRLGLKGEISYGWFTDNKYQREQVGEKYWYTKSIKYHHKEGFLRIGIPKGKWQLELGMTLDTNSEDTRLEVPNRETWATDGRITYAYSSPATGVRTDR